MVTEGTMQASKGGPTVLLSYNSYEPHQKPTMCDNPKYLVTAHIPWW